ncbi:hypothetical protein ACI65C_011336 [Semiaphis heraclei]
MRPAIIIRTSRKLHTSVVAGLYRPATHGPALSSRYSTEPTSDYTDPLTKTSSLKSVTPSEAEHRGYRPPADECCEPESPRSTMKDVISRMDETTPPLRSRHRTTTPANHAPHS